MANAPAGGDSPNLVDVVKADVLDYVHNQAHCTARLIERIREQTKLEPEQIAGAIVGVIAFLIIMSNNGQFLANLVLIAVPITVTYVFPAERPADELLLVYWPIFAVFSLLDDGLQEVIFGYYVIKIAILSLLFLKPFEYSKLAAKHTIKLAAPGGGATSKSRATSSRK